MSDKAYRDRIAASKAGLDRDLAELASENVGMDRDEFLVLARKRFNCAVTDEHADALLQDAAASAGPRR